MRLFQKNTEMKNFSTDSQRSQQFPTQTIFCALHDSVL